MDCLCGEGRQQESMWERMRVNSGEDKRHDDDARGYGTTTGIARANRGGPEGPSSEGELGFFAHHDLCAICRGLDNGKQTED
jgi:hypothetical protein